MLYILLGISAVLTFTMFHTRQMMLGFPCGIFWAITGGYCYGQSTTTWDTHYFLFFASFGMAIFCMYAAFGLREEKDTETDEGEYLDEGKDKTQYIDEVKPEEDESGVGERTKKLRERAKNRRNRKPRSLRL